MVTNKCNKRVCIKSFRRKHIRKYRNKKAKNLATILKLDNRKKQLKRLEQFIKLKLHRIKLKSKHTESNGRKISKCILKKIILI